MLLQEAGKLELLGIAGHDTFVGLNPYGEKHPLFALQVPVTDKIFRLYGSCAEIACLEKFPFLLEQQLHKRLIFNFRLPIAEGFFPAQVDREDFSGFPKKTEGNGKGIIKRCLFNVFHRKPSYLFKKIILHSCVFSVILKRRSNKNRSGVSPLEEN